MPLKGLNNVKLAIGDLKESANDDVRAVYIAGLADVTKGTPVGNPSLWLYNHPTRGYIDYIGYLGKPVGYVGGRARSNWFLSSLKPLTKTTKSTKRPAALKGMPKTVLNKTIYYTNNMPYMNKLEYDFHSSQAPKGWVRAAVIRMQNAIRNL